MDDFSKKLESVLSNPQIMGQLMSMASTLNATESAEEAPPAPQPPEPGLPDPRLLQKLSGLAARAGVEPEQQALLQALNPYLSRERLSRLERAMRAAKTARLATELLGSGGLNFLTGR